MKATWWLMQRDKSIIIVMRTNEDRRYEELLGAIEFLKTQQSGLMTTMERKNRIMKGA